MTKHIGFRVKATPANAQDSDVELFEVRQAAIDCAQLLAERGWKNIQCEYVTSRVKQFDWDESEEVKPIEWQCHFIGDQP